MRDLHTLVQLEGKHQGSFGKRRCHPVSRASSCTKGAASGNEIIADVITDSFHQRRTDLHKTSIDKVALRIRFAYSLDPIGSKLLAPLMLNP